MTAPQQISVITLPVADLERSRAFYGSGLGWEPALELPGIAFYKVGHGLLLGLMPAAELAHDSDREAASATSGTTLSHNVASVAEVDAFTARALTAGATQLKAPQRAAFGGYHAYVADPDGHVLEVAFNAGLTVASDGTVSIAELTSCDSCGFVYEELATGEIPTALAALSRDHAELLTDTEPTVLRQRPEHDIWSALEYACHVRDMLLVQRDRVLLTLTEDTPSYVPMGREERVVSGRYNEQPPRPVAADLIAAGDALAATFEALSTTEWERRGIYNYPERAVRSIAWIGRHTVHELMHHLADARRSCGSGAPGIDR